MTITRAEQERANREEVQKMRLENVFRPEITTLFNRLIRDFALTVRATGSVPSIVGYTGDIEALLKKHYERVQRSFLRTVKIKQVTEEEQERLDSLLLLTLVRWREVRAREQARIINSTNQSDLRESVDEARQLLREQEEEEDNRNLAITATPILKRKLMSRVGTIATTETQGAAESTKLFEAEALSGVEPVIGRPILGFTVSKKVWVTVGDKKVRKPHKLARGQTQNIVDPFIVGGEMLMYPGDTSLGASPANVVNCRCSSQYRIL